jgi:hypothetical protein
MLMMLLLLLLSSASSIIDDSVGSLFVPLMMLLYHNITSIFVVGAKNPVKRCSQHSLLLFRRALDGDQSRTSMTGFKKIIITVLFFRFFSTHEHILF